MFDNWPDGYFYSWLAGFWEGEGAFYFSKISKLHRYANLNITQCNYEILEAIKNKTGLGRICKMSRGTKNHRPCWRWIVGKREDIFTLSRFILPFLTFKKDFFEERLSQIKEYSRSCEYRVRWTKEEKSILFNNDNLPIPKLLPLFPDRNYASVNGARYHYMRKLCKSV